MKIGIVTFTFGDNFGQRLQNLAMQQILTTLFDADVVTLKQKKYYGKREYVKNIFNKVFEKNSIEQERHKAFEQFNKDNIKFSDFFINANTNNSEISSYDYFVVGSDQVWSPFSSDVNSTMFLTFAPKEKRVALAPSMAAEDIPISKRELYKTYLNGFKYISVREQQTARLINKYYGLDSVVLVDPTLMFDQSFWNEYIVKPTYELPDKYVLCYFLGDFSIEAKQNIEKEIGCEVIDIINDTKYLITSPASFLYLIKNATYVITDSYHGTIFSFLYNKPLAIVKRKGTNNNMNSRFETLDNKMKFSLKFSDIDDIQFKTYQTIETLRSLKEERHKFINFATTSIN